MKGGARGWTITAHTRITHSVRANENQPAEENSRIWKPRLTLKYFKSSLHEKRADPRHVFLRPFSLRQIGISKNLTLWH